MLVFIIVLIIIGCIAWAAFLIYDKINNKKIKEIEQEALIRKREKNNAGGLKYKPLTKNEMERLKPQENNSNDIQQLYGVLKNLKIKLPYKDNSLKDEFNDEIIFTISSRSQDMQDNLLNVSQGQELEIEKGENDKLYFTADGFEIGYAPAKFEETIYDTDSYYAEVNEIKETNSGSLSVKVSLKV